MKLWMNILLAVIGYCLCLALGISVETALLIALYMGGMFLIAYHVRKIRIVLQQLLEYLLENSKDAQ